MATTSKKKIALKSNWLKLYGLQITAQYGRSIKCPVGVFVNLAEMKWMVKKGKEKTKNFKFFKKPWHPDNMKCHAKEQHSMRYLEYKKLNRQSKLDYYKEEFRPLAALIRNTPALLMAEEMIVFNISRDIVKVIIHQLLLDYDPDDSAEDDNRTTENVKEFFLVNGDNNVMKHHGLTNFNLL
jgi:hypothetical protein